MSEPTFIVAVHVPEAVVNTTVESATPLVLERLNVTVVPDATDLM
jgi:hypothetical protein